MTLELFMTPRLCPQFLLGLFLDITFSLGIMGVMQINPYVPTYFKNKNTNACFTLQGLWSLVELVVQKRSLMYYSVQSIRHKRLISFKAVDEDNQYSGYNPLSAGSSVPPSSPPNAVMARCKVHCKKRLWGHKVRN